MSEVQLSQNSINRCFEMICYAEATNRFSFTEGPHFQEYRNELRRTFTTLWTQVDWKSRDSIMPILFYLESAYNRAERSSYSPHLQLDTELRADGYHFRGGQLRKLIASPASAPRTVMTGPGLFELRRDMET